MWNRGLYQVWLPQIKCNKMGTFIDHQMLLSESQEEMWHAQMRIAYAGTVCNVVARGGDSEGWGSSPELTIVEADTPSKGKRWERVIIRTWHRELCRATTLKGLVTSVIQSVQGTRENKKNKKPWPHFPPCPLHPEASGHQSPLMHFI